MLSCKNMKKPLVTWSTNNMLTFCHSMKAWSKDLDPSKASGIHFLADPAGEFTKAWDVEFDATPLLGNKRSKRYAVVTENGKVTKVGLEEDPTKVTGESWTDLSSRLQAV